MAVATATGATIEIDGSGLARGIPERIAEVVVEHDVHLPASFEIRLTDSDRAAADGVRVRIGSKVKISGTAIGGSPAPVISGEVTTLEAEYLPEAGCYFVIRGYDESHRLHRGRKTRVFTQAKYSDVAQQIAGEVGLGTGTIADTRQVKDHIPQVGQSDWELLRELAEEVDFEVRVSDGKLDFGPPVDSTQSPGRGTYGSRLPLQLIFGEDLLEFRPRVSAVGIVDTVEVRAWDGAKKAAIVGTARTGSTTSQLDETPGKLAGAFGSGKVVSVESRAVDQASADRIAERLAQVMGSSTAEAVGVARGNPAIVAGKAISVSVVGKPFAGNYTLTHTRHVFDERGYRTSFVASGRQERSLLGLIRNGRRAPVAPEPSGLTGAVTGVVTDVSDPNAAGRVKLRFEWLSPDYVTDWARVAMPGAGSGRGCVWFPEVGDEVLVVFEHGDVRRPIVIAGLWNGTDTAPPYGTPNGQPNVRGFVSLKGHSIVLNDADNAEAIEVRTAKGLSVKLDDANDEIAIHAGGSTKVTLEAGGDISINGRANVEIKAGSKLSLSANSAVEVSSGGTTTVKGQMLQLNPP